MTFRRGRRGAWAVHMWWAALSLVCHWPCVATVRVGPIHVPHATPSALFTVAVAPTDGGRDGANVPTYHEHDYNTAHVTTTTAIAVSVVSTSEDVATCIVWPTRFGVQTRSTGRVCEFNVTSVSRPWYLLVQINALEKLFVLVDRPIPLPPMPGAAGAAVHFKNVSAPPYNADASGKTDATPALQKALLAGSTPGATSFVYVPAGHYTVGASLVVPSDTVLFLDAGALVKSSSDPAVARVPRASASACDENLVPLLELAPNASGVTVTGNGRLDANGFALMVPDTHGSCSAAKGWKRRRRLLASAHGSGPMRDVTLRGVTLADATTWTIAVADVDRMVVEEVKVLNHANASTAKIENDGLDLVSSRDSLVLHSFVATVDDAMCAKASVAGAAVRNTSFIGNVVFTSCAGNKAGFQADGPYSGVVFRGTDVLHARRGVVVQSVEGAHTMQDVSFEDIRVDLLASTPTSKGSSSIRPLDIEAGSASVSGVVIRGCAFSLTAAQEAAGYYGTIAASSTSSVAGVLLDGVTVNGRCISNGEHLEVHHTGVRNVSYRCPQQPGGALPDPEQEQEQETDGRALPRSACKTELDCSLNGVCTRGGGCKCGAMWKGPTCATLALLPATKLSGLRTIEADGKNTSSWGGQVLHGEDGRWHMLAAEIIKHCGINAWTRNSRVVHATSATAGGLYTRVAPVRPVFAHEPTFDRAPDGTQVQPYFRAMAGKLLIVDGSTPKACTNGKMSKDPTFMMTAPSISGPWSNGTLVPLADCNATYCQHDMNLQGVTSSNGSFFGLVKVHATAPTKGSRAESTIHSVRSPDWRDAKSYAQSPNSWSGNVFPHLGSTGLEDPHLYMDERGRYHALFHLEEGLVSGGHGCSYDGVHWHYTGAAYNTTVGWADGTSTVFTRRERPSLIYGDLSRPRLPTHLSNGVEYGMANGDATYTLIQPIRTTLGTD